MVRRWGAGVSGARRSGASARLAAAFALAATPAYGYPVVLYTTYGPVESDAGYWAGLSAAVLVLIGLVLSALRKSSLVSTALLGIGLAACAFGWMSTHTNDLQYVVTAVSDRELHVSVRAWKRGDPGTDRTVSSAQVLCAVGERVRRCTGSDDNEDCEDQYPLLLMYNGQPLTPAEQEYPSRQHVLAGCARFAAYGIRVPSSSR